MGQAFLIRISGRVTGVGFRYSVLQWAQELPELHGYVRNVDYGEVEVMVQGPEKQVEAMIAKLRHGPPCARIDDFIINAVPPENTQQGFYVR